MKDINSNHINNEIIIYHSFIFILLSLFFYTAIFSQTTSEEYNYLTKGYKFQIESGLDMKSGYSLKDVGGWGPSYNNGEYSRVAVFKHLYRDGEEIPCATLMIISRTDTKYKRYICIPHIDSSSEIWEKAFKDFKEIRKGWSLDCGGCHEGFGYSWGMIKMISHLSSK